MTIIDSILAKIGLMKVEDHIAETNRLNLELAKQDNALSEAKAEVRKATDDLGRLVKGYGMRGELLTSARAEIASLRPDAEKWRARAERERQRGQAKRKGSGQ